MRLKMALAAGVAMLVGGCATTIKDHRGFLVDQTLVDTVAPGIDNKSSVEHTLGRPTFVSQFGEPVWYYVAVDTRQPPFRGPHVAKEVVLRVRFDAKGNVAAVDKATTTHLASIKPDRHATATLGRKRGFFEDLFGNIGTVSAVGGGAGGGGSGGTAPGPNGS